MKKFLAANKLLVGLVLVALLYAGGVVAQSYPILPVVNPGDLIQDVPNGNPTVGNRYVYPSQITSQNGYYKSVPSTAFTFIFANNQSFAQFAPSGTIASGYVTLAPAPSDGARECVFSTAQITAFYTAANSGQSINNPFTGDTLSANTQACFLYSASNLTWDRD